MKTLYPMVLLAIAASGCGPAPSTNTEAVANAAPAANTEAPANAAPAKDTEAPANVPPANNTAPAENTTSAKRFALAENTKAPANAARESSDKWTIALLPSNSFKIDMYRGSDCLAHVGAVGWGPNWNPWFAPKSNEKATGGELRVSSPLNIGDPKPTLTLAARADGRRKLVCSYRLKSESDIPVLMTIVSFGLAEGVSGTAVLTGPDGGEKTTKLPVNGPDFGVVENIKITSPAFEGPLELAIDPPTPVKAGGALRIMLADGLIPRGERAVRLTWTFPTDADVAMSEAEMAKFAPVVPTSDWFPYDPGATADAKPSAIAMNDWLDRPAGKHGGVRIQGDGFAFEDGLPVKFWGSNLSYIECAPIKEDADSTAARFAKYGVNAVRLHKFTGLKWEGIGDPNDSTKMNPEGLDRLDYFSSRLAGEGVYYGWSHTFVYKVLPGDRGRLSGYDELMKKKGKAYALVNWAEDVQDLMIERVVNLLKHRNPYTGKTYAEDPALCFVELQNEDDIFFFTSKAAYNDFPTYAKQLRNRFARWLTAKYGSQEKLAAAWRGAIKANERLSEGNLAVELNPWNMGKGLPKADGGPRRRMLDNAEFLHFVQDEFYSRFVKAIRDAGYKGPLIGSPWQAAPGVPHYYNLLSDAQVGYVDRHNYFGGKLTASMLATPGGGYLSSGLQQVKDRPFGVSEWIHVYPSLYSAEGPVLMAAYGMGLQGWDASYQFQSSSKPKRPAQRIVGALPFGVWNADTPNQIGQYPVLARMVLRGDVRTAPVVSTRRVSKADLRDGTLNFTEEIVQHGDVKTFTGSVPAETLAVGRALVEFVEQSAPSSLPDLTKSTHGSVITSTTGQLKWDVADGGRVAIDTPGTQGYVGFSRGEPLTFADLTIQPATPYAAVLVTAADPKADLATGVRVLISAVARNANTGFRMFALDDKTVVDNGQAPILMEPVKADVSFLKRKVKRVDVLDHDGVPTGRTLPVRNGAFTIDGAKEKAFYYEVVLE